MNIEASEAVFRALHDCGVRDVIFCAGARNSPLIAVLEKTSGFERHAFFEERSAAFFALGRCRRDHRPAAVITTSGTAAAELLPATIEAFHTGVPLILVTADRPRRLRGTGAPQAIDQTGLFAKFVSLELDLEAGERLNLTAWDRCAPLHLNICFDEPLLDAHVNSLELPVVSGSVAETRPPAPVNHARVEDACDKIDAFLRRVRRPVAIVSTLETPAEREVVESFLTSLNIPVYAESTSGLRHELSSTWNANSLQGGDRVLNWALANGCIDGIVRIGGVPTARIWRDLEAADCPAQVLSLSSLPFSGLSRGELLQTDLVSTLVHWSQRQRQNGRVAFEFDQQAHQAILKRDREAALVLERLMQTESEAEPALVRQLSALIPVESLMYVGNSLPIREWDLAAVRRGSRVVQANRGVNGIDGQLSTFLGLLPPGGEGWALVGDLTTLYDLTSPWALAADPEARVRIVVLNNGGGKIFSRLFKSPLFESRHDLGFESWAKMWGLDYECWTHVPSGAELSARPPLADRVVIELRPDDAATMRFWDHFDAQWKSR